MAGGDNKVTHKGLEAARAQAAQRAGRHPLELRITVICDACGSIVNATWVKNEDWLRQAVIVVDKCPCDSPLLKG